MNTQDLIVQQPPTPLHLVLLFHGVGSNAPDLAPLGEALAPHLPDAVIVSVQAPDAAGRGWHWFSVQGVTEADRPARVAAAMPGFVQTVQRWQEAAALAPAQTTLIGFSQGGTVALEATADSSASGLRFDTVADVAEYPWLSWRWKVPALNGKVSSIRSAQRKRAR